MTQLRYPNITGKTPEERQNQMERYVRSLVDQLNMQKTTQEPTQTQENTPQTPQPKIDFSKMFESHIAEYWKKIYPIGSIYLSVSATSPEKIFGGKWEQIKDRFLLAAGSTYTAGGTGGEAKHVLTTSELPSHNHELEYSTDDGATYNKLSMGKDGTSTREYYFGFSNSVTSFATYKARVRSTGGGAGHNNMPPYLAVYIWKRIA